MIKWREINNKKKKLNKTRIRINPLNREDIADNNISILFSTFNTFKSNKVGKKDPTSNIQNKSENDQQFKDFSNWK